MKRITVSLVCTLMLALLMSAAPLVSADDHWRTLHEEVQAGRVKPLSDVLDALMQDWVGQVVDVEYEHERGRKLYEIELLGEDGQVVEFEVDAVTGELIGIEGSNINAMKRQP